MRISAYPLRVVAVYGEPTDSPELQRAKAAAVAALTNRDIPDPPQSQAAGIPLPAATTSASCFDTKSAARAGSAKTPARAYTPRSAR